MKKTLVLGLAIGLVSLAAAAFAGPSVFNGIPAQGDAYTGFGGGQKNHGGQGIVGSSHDMSGVVKTNGGIGVVGLGGRDTALKTGGTDKQKRICVYCHHPHRAIKQGNASDQLAYSPLWNRDVIQGSYTGYNNGIMMGTSSDTQHKLNAGTTGITGVSLLCMSCHDGTVAMNAYSVSTGSPDTKGDAAASSKLTGSAQFGGATGKDMSNHHPMGFSYTAVTSHDGTGNDNEIASPNTVMVPSNIATIAGTKTAPSGTGVTIGDLLYGTNKTMECVTCHDVHNTANAPNAERFLWRSDNESNFCLACHLK